MLPGTLGPRPSCGRRAPCLPPSPPRGHGARPGPEGRVLGRRRPHRGGRAEAQASTMPVTSAPGWLTIAARSVAPGGRAQVKLESFNVKGSELPARRARPAFCTKWPAWAWAWAWARHVAGGVAGGVADDCKCWRPGPSVPGVPGGGAAWLAGLPECLSTFPLPSPASLLCLHDHSFPPAGHPRPTPHPTPVDERQATQRP